MNRVMFVAMWLSVIALLVACDATADVSQLPTRAVLPSLTPTATATLTPTATATPSATATDPATATPTVTASNTPLPSATPTRTLTFTPTVSATPTNTNTPTPTNTPIATNTPVQPQIAVFQSDITQGEPGDPLRLRWDADADEVRLERLDQAGSVLETIPVESLGAVNFVLPETTDNIVVYRLVAVRGSNEIFSSLSIDIGSACPVEWFFAAPDDAGCAAAPFETVQLVYQTLERGFMFRLTTPTLDQVCGVHTTRSNVYVCYPPGDFNGTPPATPPDGLQVPASDLLLPFYTQLGLEGLLYQSLGWAIDVPFVNNTILQRSADGFLYLRTPSGVYRFDADLAQDFVIAPRVAEA